MNSMKIKKPLIKLLPYIIVGLVCTNLGEAWRLAEGDKLGFIPYNNRYISACIDTHQHFVDL